MAKCKSAVTEKRNQEMRDYYQELRRTGYMQKLALNLVREKFNLDNITLTRIEYIVTHNIPEVGIK
jgi:hypothetical protein